MSVVRVPAIIFGAAAVFALSGCEIGGEDRPVPADTGPVESRSFAAADFNNVTAATPDRIVIRRGDTFAVAARGRAALLDRLAIDVDGSTLRIRREGTMREADLDRLGTAVVTVTLPRLTGITLAGSGEVMAEQVDGPNAALVLAGSGDMTVSNAMVQAMDVTLAGSGDISMTGRAERADVTVAGSGSVNGVTFGARRADVTVAGSGDVAMAVTDNADVTVLGSGDVAITGGATCTTSRRGSGNVTCTE